MKVGDKVKIVRIGKSDAHYVSKDHFIGKNGTLTRIGTIKYDNSNYCNCHIDMGIDYREAIFLKVLLKKV